MHGAHDGNTANAGVDHLVQKEVMTRQIPHVGRGIVVKAVTPCKMQANIGHLVKQLRRGKRRVEHIDLHPPGSRVATLDAKVEGIYACAHIAQRSDNVAADISVRARNGN